MDINNLQFVDLGLPSGRLWATENVKDENCKEAHFTFGAAVNTFGKNLPSKEDWKELFDNSTCSWNEGRKGYNVVGPNGNSIFLPAAGCRLDIGVNKVSKVGSDGYYWSSSPYYEVGAYCVYFYYDISYPYPQYPQGVSYRWDGLSVRLVR